MKSLLPAWRRVGSVAALCLSYCGIAHAQLPWETPLQTLQTSLTGPVAKAIGVICLAISGAMLAFGGELSDFTRRILMVVLALSVMLMANQFMSIFG
jgi:type IV secretion system protein VirB2